MSTVYNFALKPETSCVKKVTKPILETRNANNIIAYHMFDLFIIK